MRLSLLSADAIGEKWVPQVSTQPEKKLIPIRMQIMCALKNIHYTHMKERKKTKTKQRKMSSAQVIALLLLSRGCSLYIHTYTKKSTNHLICHWKYLWLVAPMWVYVPISRQMVALRPVQNRLCIVAIQTMWWNNICTCRNGIVNGLHQDMDALMHLSPIFSCPITAMRKRERGRHSESND